MGVYEVLGNIYEPLSLIISKYDRDMCSVIKSLHVKNGLEIGPWKEIGTFNE